jgi:trimeric autotransporter adhesin
MYANTTGVQNTAIGYKALLGNTTGYNNTAIGEWAIWRNTTGTNNIGVGPFGLNGSSVFTASNVIAIGHPGQNLSNSCWIGNKPMDKASETILALKPVTFQYTSDGKIRRNLV